LIGIFLGWHWIKFWLGVPMDADDDNPALFGLAGLTPGFIFYWIQTARYRNMNARHKHEAETKADVDNMKKTDVSIGRRNRLRNARIAGQNDSVVKGAVAHGGKRMMGEKMANWLGIGRMKGSSPADNQPKGNDVDVKVEAAAKGMRIVRRILIIWVVMIFMAVAFFMIMMIVGDKESDTYENPSFSKLTDDIEEWADKNDYRMSNGKFMSENICLLESRSSDKYQCYFPSGINKKFSVIADGIYSGESVRNIRSLEFPFKSEDELHRILVNRNIKYRKTMLDHGIRYTFYMSGSYSSKKNTYCTLMESMYGTKNSDGDYKYLLQLVCGEIEREDIDDAHKMYDALVEDDESEV
jgi:hypothetical protein